MEARKTVPLIVASAIIMQQIDSTALATAIPAIAESFGEPALRLHSAITIYLLSLGVFLPMSSWVADRFGARRVFCAAIGIFTLASLLCAASTDLTTMVLARAVQGFGGALMLPVGRLILVRSVSQQELVSAMILMSLPTAIGPAIGPLLGGFITGVSSWRWIFWINLPVGALGILLTLLFIKDVEGGIRQRFDMRGFLLSGTGIGALILGLDAASHGRYGEAVLLAVAGLAATGLYVRHAARVPDAILDLKLFRFATFRASLLGGSLFRIGFAALPFMLPLLMQEVFGYSPLQSGAITFVSAVGAFGMRTVMRRILRRIGFRRVLVWNALIAAISMASYASFSPGTAPWIMMLIIFLGGVVRALQFTSINTLAFADITAPEMGHATALSQMAQRVSQSLGVAFAAMLLHLFNGGGTQLTGFAFEMAFLVVALTSGLSCLSFVLLPPTAGDVLAGREGAMTSR
ncbi:MAG TPA: DHA2 family efflux MFS transporter permease subunit [Roseomonas sp.]